MFGRRRPKASSAALQQIYDTESTGTLETAAELALQAFLLPYHPSDIPDLVRTLTAAGYTSVESLRSLDDAAVAEAGVRGDDAQKLILASFLYSVGLPQYGESCVASGCRDLLKLYALSDAGLKRAGVATIGHRRQLQKYLRESDIVLQKLQKREEEEAEERRAAQRSLAIGPSDGAAAGHKLSSGASRGKRGGRAGGRGRGGAHAAHSGGGPDDGLQDGTPTLPLRFAPEASVEPWARRQNDDPAGLESLPVGSSGNINSWTQPLFTTMNAALLGGAPPGLRGECHYEAKTPRDGLQLVGNARRGDQAVFAKYNNATPEELAQLRSDFNAGMPVW